MNGKAACIHGLKEIIMLKCPHYGKLSTGSM
jgi:hypothetical protein